VRDADSSAAESLAAAARLGLDSFKGIVRQQPADICARQSTQSSLPTTTTAAASAHTTTTTSKQQHQQQLQHRKAHLQSRRRVRV
jgi:hypothetical protein